MNVDDLETNHVVLVHGGGFGAWCWYKSIALLEESGYKVTAIDLTGSGVSSFDANSITSLSQYVKPLTNFLEKLLEGEKVLGKLSIFITNGLIYSILIIYLYWLCSILITSENNFFVNFLSIYSLLFFFGFLSR